MSRIKEAKFDGIGPLNFVKVNSLSSQTYLSNTVMPNLECRQFIESERLTWATKFDRIWSLEFREIELTELSNIPVSGFAKNAKGAVTQHKTWPLPPRKCANVFVLILLML